MNDPSHEGERIYFTIFRRRIPSVILAHFNNLSEKIEARFSKEEITYYYRYLEKVNDLEALELAARHLKKLPVLTVKFKAMLYLAETLPENYTSYINDKNRSYSAHLILIAAVFRSFFKFMKGIILLIAYKS
jgi:hypothetical protein